MKLVTFLSIITLFLGCTKTNNPQEIIPVPNGDFENWDAQPTLLNWQTNSCPLCVQAIERNIVVKDPNASNGLFAAKFIYNNAFTAWAINNFSIPKHPSTLSGYVKSSITSIDTIRITITLYKNMVPVDSGSWVGTSSIANYTKIDIPISQNSSDADSALIRIEGGQKLGTEFWVDNLYLIKI